MLRKGLLTLVGLGLVLIGIALAEITSAPDICNTPSAHCIDTLPVYPGAIVGLFGTVSAAGAWLAASALRRVRLKSWKTEASVCHKIRSRARNWVDASALESRSNPPPTGRIQKKAKAKGWSGYGIFRTVPSSALARIALVDCPRVAVTSPEREPVAVAILKLPAK